MEEEEARRDRRLTELGPGGGQADLISSLPEDPLLQVLVRLRCSRAAARTSLVSRRCRGLWTRLPDLTFRGVTFRSVQAALGSLQGEVNPGVSLLDIAFTSLEAAAADPVPAEVLLLDPGYDEEAARVSSLLRAAAALSPIDFRLSLPCSQHRVDVDLPRFHRATSIQLHSRNLRLTPPRPSGEFTALDRLSLSGCWVDLAALVLRCPCLRVLSISNACLHASIDIQSESLQELLVRTDFMPTDRINIKAPMLKQLTLFFHTGAVLFLHTGADLSVSVMAPIVERVSWECSYSVKTTGLAPWGLLKVSLRAGVMLGRRVMACIEDKGSNVYVLSLLMMACDWFYAQPKFVQEMEKHLVTDFSVLDLTMAYDYDRTSAGHVFGPFVLHLLGMHRISTATRRLQIRSQRSKVKQKCPVNCPCDEPKNWRSKNISLINLEEVEIEGFEGEDHEFDFLKVIFRCAPMLKRMDVWMPNQVKTSRCMQIYDIFYLYPLVECKLMRKSGVIKIIKLATQQHTP